MKKLLLIICALSLPLCSEDSYERTVLGGKNFKATEKGAGVLELAFYEDWSVVLNGDGSKTCTYELDEDRFLWEEEGRYVHIQCEDAEYLYVLNWECDQLSPITGPTLSMK